MKNFLTVLIVLIVLNAQDKKFGFTGSLNMASQSFDGEGSEQLESSFGYSFGLFGNFSVNESIAIQPELLFMKKGTGIDVGNDDFDVNMNLNYLEIPISVVFHTNEKFDLMAGPYISFFNSGKMEVTYKDDSDSETLDDETFKSTEFGFHVGAMVHLNENIGIGLRFSKGLTDIYEGSEEKTTSNNLQGRIQFTF